MRSATGGRAAPQMLKTVSPKDTVLAAMQLMMDFNFRHVPVVRLLAQSRHPAVHNREQFSESPSVCDAISARLWCSSCEAGSDPRCSRAMNRSRTAVFDF